MFSFTKASSNRFQPSLFDIRLHSASRNILFLEGQTGEANKLVLSGHVVFAIPEEVSLKAVNLNLVGVFRLDFLESFQNCNGKVVAACPVRRQKIVVRCEWDNLLTSPKGRVVKAGVNDEDKPENTKGRTQQALRMISTKRKSDVVYFSKEIPTGITPFSSSESSRSEIQSKDDDDSTMYKLPRGNYSLPFTVELPGDIPETVEGLRCGVVLYRLESRLRGSKQFRQEPRARKYVRIFRRPLQTELLLCEDCSVESTWPNKVEYEVRLPKKALPMGGKAKIHILVVPLVKGLRLGKINASIQQYFSLKGEDEESYEDEKTVYQCTLPSVPMEDMSPDKWSLEARITLPKNLKQCTPDVELKDDLIRVRHKLAIDINIINCDGHTSQVRSRLPIILYLSGQDVIFGRNTYIDRHGRIRFKSGRVPLFKDVPKKNSTEVVEIPDTTDELIEHYRQLSLSTPSLNRQTVGRHPIPRSHSYDYISNNSASNSDEEGTQEVRVDPDYDFDRRCPVGSNTDTEPSPVLPSYKDSGKDIHLDPQFVSPLVSPAPIAEGPTTSYFDLPQLKSQTKPVEGPKFDNSINEIPSYNSVYDVDFPPITDDPAPPYEDAVKEGSSNSSGDSSHSDTRISNKVTPPSKEQPQGSSTLLNSINRSTFKLHLSSIGRKGKDSQ